jgi:hypothetical protein
MVNKETATEFLRNLIEVTYEKIKEIHKKFTINDNATELEKKNNEQQIYREFNTYQPWSISYDKTSNPVEKMTEEVKKDLKTVSQINKLIKNYTFTGNLNNIDKTTRLYIFLDEAGSLLDDSEVNDVLENKTKAPISKFKVMRRAIIDLCHELPIVFYLADTNGKVAEFISNERTISASEREAIKGPNGKPVYDSFYKFLYIDEFVPRNYRPSLDIHETRYTTILNRDPRENLFLYGRPLWNSVIKLPIPLTLPKQKLICASSWANVAKKDRLFASLAIISVRTTLSFNYNLIYDQELVSRYLSTLFYIEPDRKNYATR